MVVHRSIALSTKEEACNKASAKLDLHASYIKTTHPNFSVDRIKWTLSSRPSKIVMHPDHLGAHLQVPILLRADFHAGKELEHTNPICNGT